MWPMVGGPSELYRAVLTGRAAEVARLALGAFREELATFGWVEGRNLRIDYRFAATGDPGRLAGYAEELVNLRPDLIFAIGGSAAQAVQQRCVYRKPHPS